MGITFSTQNYEKIINLIEEPYLHNLQSINSDLVDAINIDNNRKLVYKHRTREMYLLYCGGICEVSQCFEVNENFLLKQSHQFSNFYALKDFILQNYPKSELIMELIKYESKNYIDIIDILERGEFNEVIIDFDFTDSESGSESDSYNTPSEDIIDDTTDINGDIVMGNLDDNICSSTWGADWDYDSYSFTNVISNWEYNYGDFCCPVNTDETNSLLGNKLEDQVFDDFFPYTSIFDSALESAYGVSKKAYVYSDNIIKNLDNELLVKFVDQAVNVAKDAARDANNIADECNKDIRSISMYNINYLEVVEEELNQYDSDDDSDNDLILPNMNYFKKFE